MENVIVRNAGWEFAEIGAGDDVPEKVRIRGYKLAQNAAQVVAIPPSTVGVHIVTGSSD